MFGSDSTNLVFLVPPLRLVPVGGERLVDLGELASGGLLCLLPERELLLLLLEEVHGVDLALVLQSLEEVLVLPSDRVGQVAHHGVLTAGLEAHDAEGGGDDDALLLVEWGGDPLEGRKAGQRLLPPGRLLVDHPANRPPHDQGGALLVEGASSGVGVHVQGTELRILDAIACHCSACAKKQDCVRSKFGREVNTRRPEIADRRIRAAASPPSLLVATYGSRRCRSRRTGR
jgi:hypothetical protein